MRKILVLLAIMFGMATIAFAQVSYSTVTATVTDPNGNPYANASLTANLVNSAGYPVSSASTPNGQLFNAKQVLATLDAAGHFSIQLAPNNILSKPSGTQWLISIVYPQNTAILTTQSPWTINYSLSVTGSIDLSSQISSLTQPVNFINLLTGQNTLISTRGCLGGNTVASGCTGATTASGAWTNIFSGASIATNCAVLSTGSGGALTCSPISYLPLTGGTLAGALNGTSANFSGTVAAGVSLTAPDAISSSSSTEAATINNLRNATARSVKEFGVKGNGIFSDFKMTTGSNVVILVDVTSGYNFASGDVGKLISLPKVDSDGATLYTTITGYTDSTHVTVAAAASFSFDGSGTFRNQAVWATDDTAAINTALAWTANGPGPGLGSTRDIQFGLYFPCGIYGVSQQISITRPPAIEGQSTGCVDIMYMGTSSVDAAVEIMPANLTLPVLRQGYYLNATNHPEIGTCTGTACSPTINGSIPGFFSNLSVYGNKFSNWALSILSPANFESNHVTIYSGNTGSFYDLNGVQNTWNSLATGTSLPYGNSGCANGLYFDGTIAGQGSIPTTIISPSATNCTGTGMSFNLVAQAQVTGAQVSASHQSLNVSGTSGGIAFISNLFEGSTISDVIAGDDNGFIGTQFTGAGLALTGTRNAFLKAYFAFSGGAKLAISGENNGFTDTTLASTSALDILDTSKTTQWRGVSTFSMPSPAINWTTDQSATAIANISISPWNDPVISARGTWVPTSTSIPVNIVTSKFAYGEHWKAIFIGTWIDNGTVVSTPTYLELTDAANVFTIDSTNTATFSINSSGYFQMAINSIGCGFSGTVILIPKLGVSAPGATSMQLAGDLKVQTINGSPVGGTYVPPWLQYLGDNSDGAFSCTTGTCSIGNGEHWYTTFSISSGAIVTTNAAYIPLVIRANTCTILGTISYSGNTGELGSDSKSSGGGSGGGGGGGAAAGAAGSSSNSHGVGAGGALSGGNAGSGSSSTGNEQKMYMASWEPYLNPNTSGYNAIGGAVGGRGGSTGGLGGYGGGAIVLDCGTMTFTGTADVSGTAGGASTGNSIGAGGGGGGGFVIMRSPNWVANTGSINVAGGSGGTCGSFTTCGTGGAGAAGWSHIFTN